MDLLTIDKIIEDAPIYESILRADLEKCNEKCFEVIDEKISNTSQLKKMQQEQSLYNYITKY